MLSLNYCLLYFCLSVFGTGYLTQPVFYSVDLLLNSEILAEQLAQANLASSDLPSRFEPAPAFLEQFIIKGMASVKPYLQQKGIVINKLATFVDLEQPEVVIALTSNLSDRQAVTNFDTELRRQDAQSLLVTGLEQSLQKVGKIQIKEVRELSSLKEVGNLARGFTIEARFTDLPLSLFTEAVAFRRGQSGALIIVSAINHPLTEVHASELALQLDRRFQGLGK